MYQMLATLEPDSKMPAHQHPQETDRPHLIGANEINCRWDAARNEERGFLLSRCQYSDGVETIEETKVLDTFSPPRDEYLAIDEANRQRK